MKLLTWAALFLLPLAHGKPVSGAAGSVGGNQKLRIQAPYNTKFKPDPYARHKITQKWQSRMAHHKGLGNQLDNIGVGNVTARSEKKDLEYLATVGFGTPPQWLPVDLDTGSADVWIYSDRMSSFDLVGDRKWYRPSDSSTAVMVPNSTWKITYGDGGQASGVVFDDVINIGGIEIQHATVEAAETVTGNFEKDIANSGVFGLAIGIPAQTKPLKPTVWSQMADTLQNGLFTVDLKWRADSEFWFGEIDNSKIHNNYGTFNLLPIPDPYFPGIQFWSLNYTILPTNSTGFGSRENFASIDEPTAPRSCIIDTGSTLIMVPTKQADAYYAQIQDVMFDEMYGYMFPCNQNIPDLHLSFGDDHIYAVPGKYIAYIEVPELPGMCLGGIQPDDSMDFSIMGDVFLKSVYAVFDADYSSIGFASKPLN
ncbi:Aspartic peptidase domain containing protein [Naviculisporaceae sp. PSN 640]